MNEKTIRAGVSAGGLSQTYQKENSDTLGRAPAQKGEKPETTEMPSVDATALNSLLQQSGIFQGGVFRSGVGVEGRVETNPVLVTKQGIGELKKFLKDWEVLKNERNFDAKTGETAIKGWKNHLEERVKVLKFRMNELLVDWANQNPGVSAKIGIPESEIHFPELEEVREFLRQSENRLQELQSLSEAEIKTPKILSGKFQQFLELDASIIAWFLKYQIRAVEKIPVEGDLKETGFLSGLVQMVNSTSDWEGRVSGYEKVFAQVEREGLRRAMLGRAYYFGKMMQKPIDRIDWIFQKSIDFVTLGSDLTEVKVQPLAPEYEAMAGKYREMAAKLDDLSVTVESVQKNFSEFEVKHADAIKKLEEQFKSEMFYSSLSIVIVSAGVGTIAEAVVAPLLARAGLSALALEGSGAETTAAVLRLVASQGGAAVNAFGFTLASRALTNKIQGDGSFLLINPKKSLLTNFAEIGTETVGMYLMCKWLGLALGKYMNTVDGMLMARAEKNVAKLGIEQGSAAYYEALVKEVGQLSEKNWLQFGVKIGGFVTEYAALNVWDLAKLTLASEEEKKNFNLSDHALESLKFLIGLKIGNKLVSPLTVPMHEWAQQRALAPYKTELDTLDQQIQSAQELLQQGPEKVGQALEEMTQALEQKLALYKQIPEGIRNKKEQAEVEHNLRILQAVLAKDKNQLSENQPENREVAAPAEPVVPVQYGRDDSGPVLIPPQWKPLPEGFSEEKLNALLSEVRTSTIDPQKWNNYPSPVPERILHSLLRENSANLETMNQLAQIILERVRRGEKIDSETAFGGLWEYSNKTLNPLKKIALEVLSFQFEKSEKEKGEQNRASGIMTLGGEEVWTAAFFKNFLNHETIDQDLQLIVDVAQRIEDPSRREVFVRWMKFLGSFVSVWDKPKVEKVMADLDSQKVASTSSPLTSIATTLGLGGAVSLLEGCLNTVSQNAPEVGQAMDAAAQQSGSPVWPWLVGAATLLGLARIGYKIHQSQKVTPTATPNKQTNQLAGETLDRVRSPQSIENSLPSKSLLLILKEALKGESYFDLLVKDAQQGENPGGRILRAFSPLLGKWGSGNSGYDRIDLELRLKKDFETLLLSRGDFSKVEEHEIAALENGLDVDLDLRLNLNGKVFSGRFSKANNRGEDLLVSDVKLNFESKEDRQLFYKTFYEKLKKNCEKLNMPEESYDGRYDEYQTSLLSFFQELFPSSSLEEIEKNHAWDSQKVMDWKVRPISIDSFIEWKAKPAIRRDDSFGFAIFRRRTREIGAAILKTLQEMGMEVRISRRQS